MPPIICPSKNKMCHWEFRPFNAEDLPQTRDFLKRTFPHMEHYFPNFERELLSNDAYVLKDRHTILGVLDIGNYFLDPTKKWINLIGVDPTYQRQQIGKQLLEKAEEIVSKKYHAHELHLITEGYRKSNIRFYQKNGWKIAKIQSGLYPHTLAFHLMKQF